MSNWSREDLGVVAVGVVLFVGVLAGVSVTVAVGVVVGVVGGGIALGVSVRGRRRDSQAPAGLRTVRPFAARSLRWVRGLLPGDEGTAWWAEVTSCLAETPDPGERRRYVRSYRRGVPRLIWTSWTEHLSASRQRELS